MFASKLNDLHWLVIARARTPVVSEFLFGKPRPDVWISKAAFVAAAHCRYDVVVQMYTHWLEKDETMKSAIEAAATFGHTVMLRKLIEIARPTFDELRLRALKICAHARCSYPGCDWLELRDAMCCAASVGDVAALNVLADAGALKPPLFVGTHLRQLVAAAISGGHPAAIQWVQANTAIQWVQANT